jgi:hypothetical protein
VILLWSILPHGHDEGLSRAVGDLLELVGIAGRVHDVRFDTPNLLNLVQELSQSERGKSPHFRGEIESNRAGACESLDTS